jgi:hypothetical protein
MGWAFFDRDSSGAVKLGDAAVLSAVFCFCGRGRPRAFWQIWRAAILAAGLLRPRGARAAPTRFCSADPPGVGVGRRTLTLRVCGVTQQR